MVSSSGAGKAAIAATSRSKLAGPPRTKEFSRKMCAKR